VVACTKEEEEPSGRKKKKIGGPVVGWKFAWLGIFRKPYRIGGCFIFL
jgi:hypothetical protein